MKLFELILGVAALCLLAFLFGVRSVDAKPCDCVEVIKQAIEVIE